MSSPVTPGRSRLPKGKPLQHFDQCDPAPKASPGSTKPEVDAVAKGQVTSYVPMDVEAVTGFEVAIVPIARPVEQDHHTACGNPLAVQFDISGDKPSLHW
jgi:hypothetical protein